MDPKASVQSTTPQRHISVSSSGQVRPSITTTLFNVLDGGVYVLMSKVGVLSLLHFNSVVLCSSHALHSICSSF